MVKRFTFSFLLFSFLTLQITCKSEDSYIPVAIHPEADFIEDVLPEMAPVYRVLSYESSNRLFTANVLKKSFIWLPTGEETPNTLIWYYSQPCLGFPFKTQNV